MITCLVELVLVLSDRGAIGEPSWRQIAYQHGAFWSGLLNGWQPVFPGQSATMFVSYAFLHGGLLHLAGNMVAVLAIGGIVVARAGERGFLWLYLIATLGGGVGFALLSSSPQPMVGASGAVFGLIGAWKFWEWETRRIFRAPMAPLWRFIAGLVVLNVVLWLALSGLLAWQAHLGGFVAGWLWAALFTRTHRAAW